MKFNILTLFPEMFPGFLDYSLAGKALKKGIWSYDTINIRDFVDEDAGAHKAVDDTPYGGGAGMVMRADIIDKAIESLPVYKFTSSRVDELTGSQAQKPVNRSTSKPGNQKIIYPSPRGELLNQRKVEELSSLDELTILCGRYEGVDQRILDKHQIEEVSLGDYILSAGETAAFVIIDACIRKLDGVIGNSQTHEEESFASGDFEFLLEYPLYTKPRNWDGIEVPEVLISGNHKKIKDWRLDKAEELTKLKRPDLWKEYKKYRLQGD